MGRYYSARALNYALVVSTAVIVSAVTYVQQSQALTASYGAPYHGRIENGVIFPNQFPGYHLRDENRSYTTPEVVGALLDAIEAVRTEFPDTCDVFLGDFSISGGGSAIHHRSHQNGRDVDIGMYRKGNVPMETFVAMNEDNLDAPKTWCLIENIIRSQRVQYIFLDRRLQKVLYEYAVTRGYDQSYLDRVFGNVRGSLIQHVRNHYDHMHVRFFTPWSTLAAHIGDGETEKSQVVDIAQQSYMPTKVNYYVNGSESNLDAIAQSFGATKRDLCRWNRLSPNALPVPGSCLVFYKRSFESEPVLLARSIQPGYIAEAPRIRVASVQTESSEPVKMADAAGSDEEQKFEEETVEPAEPAAPRRSAQSLVYKVRRGDTLAVIAKRSKADVNLICKLNGISKTTKLVPGRSLKTGTRMVVADSGQTATDAPKKASSSSPICFTSDPKKPNGTAAFYTVGRGDTLQRISRKSGISIDVLCQLNSLRRNAGLKPGQKIKLTQANLRVRPALGPAACPINYPAGKGPAVKGSPSRQVEGAQDAKAPVKAVPKVEKASEAKSAKTVTKSKSAKTAAVAKSASKPSGKAASASKSTVKVPAAAKKNVSKKAVEAKSGKPVKRGETAGAKQKSAPGMLAQNRAR